MSDIITVEFRPLSLADAHAELDVLLADPLTVPTDGELLDAWRELETLRRRLAGWENHLAAEIDSRGIACGRGWKNTAALARELLHLTPADATARIAAARERGPRRQFGTGTPIDPVFPLIAAAQETGAISERHARIITDFLKRLPAEIREDAHDPVEQLLVAEAATCDPTVLAQAARQVDAHLNPDGAYREAAYRERTRALDLRVRPDGSAHLVADLTAEATERLRTVLDALTHPRNLHPAGAEIAGDSDTDVDSTRDSVAAVDVGAAGDGNSVAEPSDELAPLPDPRSATQRRHDAFLAALKLLPATDLPTAGGVHTTVVITMTDHAWHTGEGTARTGHGTHVPAGEAIAWAGGNPRLLAVAIDDLRGITAYSSVRRCFTEQQRLALLARDRGCSFPGCDAGIWYCEADHVIPWADQRLTRVDNGHLVCATHHRHAKTVVGWTVQMINGRPAWTAPPWLDPDQIPRFNTLHHTDLNLDAVLDLDALYDDS